MAVGAIQRQHEWLGTHDLRKYSGYVSGKRVKADIEPDITTDVTADMRTDMGTDQRREPTLTRR